MESEENNSSSSTSGFESNNENVELWTTRTSSMEDSPQSSTASTPIRTSPRLPEANVQDSSESSSSAMGTPMMKLRSHNKNGHRRTVSASFTLPKKVKIRSESNGLRERRRRVLSAGEEQLLEKQFEEGDEVNNRQMIESVLKGYLDEVDDVLERLFTNVTEGVKQKAGDFKHKAEFIKDSMATKAGSIKQGVQNKAADIAEKLRNWKACHHEKLPGWMKDNEHLHFGHRPEMPSFYECFKSVFRIHTETGNIWTHLIGFILFLTVTIIFYVKPLCATCQLDIELSEKLIFLCFFIGAILCLAFSTIFHTVACHSPWANGVFSRLDYAGIAILIVGSIIPWLYYGFYCHFYTKLTYMTCIIIMGIAAVIVTMFDKFSTPEYRVMRTLVFIFLGGSGIVPGLHHIIVNGFANSMLEASMHWTLIMGALYITGAVLYAARIPERFMPGKCDIWFQSHQIFHVLVIIAAFVHYHGMSEMAIYRLTQQGQCGGGGGGNQPPSAIVDAEAVGSATTGILVDTGSIVTPVESIKVF